MNGFDIIYYDDGSIMQTGVYKNGLKNGVFKKYNTLGKIIDEDMFKEDKVIKY